MSSILSLFMFNDTYYAGVFFFLLENALSCSGLLPLEKTIQRRNIIEKSLKKVYEILLQARDIFCKNTKTSSKTA